MTFARLLDVTRLVSRLGKGPQTGIDRVEQAYLAEFLAQSPAVFGLVRTALGFLLLDREGLIALRDQSVDLGFADFASRLAWRKDPARARAETGLRGLAVARCLPHRLAAMLRAKLPRGAIYFNTGHANLDQSTLRRIAKATVGLVVLVHDTIPLDHPTLCRPDTPERFRQAMQAVSALADLVIFSTQDARRQAEVHFARFGRVPNAVVAPLGVVPAPPEPLTFTPSQPYFLCLGTIEPRKNHALLLDIWQELPQPVPQLYLAGTRGWASADLLERLDALPKDGPVQLLTGLRDGQISTLLSGARALLFPSLAEGFGIPAFEAAAQGTPLVLSDITVFQEIAPTSAILLDPTDIYVWRETIGYLAAHKHIYHTQINPPTWRGHFNLVFTTLA